MIHRTSAVSRDPSCLPTCPSTVGSAGAAGYDFTTNGAVLWVDFSDADTVSSSDSSHVPITVDSTGIGRVVDKIGGVVFSQSTSSRRPPYLLAGQNGLNVAHMDSPADNRFLLSATGLDQTPNQSIFAVCQVGGSRGMAPLSTRDWHRPGLARPNWGGVYASSSLGRGLGTLSLPEDTWVVLESHVVYVDPTSTPYVYSNGTSVSLSWTSDATGTLAMDAIGIDDWSISQGKVAEVAVFQGDTFGFDNRATIRQALADKWGIVIS